MSTSRILSKVPSDLANNIGKVLTVGEDNSLLWSIANSEPAFSRANLAFTTATSAGSNTVYLQGALDQTNTNISSSNTQLKSYTDGQISDVNNHIQTVYDSSNTKFSSSGGVISGAVEISSSLLVTGNLTVTGNVTSVSANNLTVQDNMIYLNANNYVSNPDLGFAGNYNDGTYRHAGFFRDATDGVWKVFDSYLPEPDASPYIDTSNSSFRIASFQANTFIGSGASLTSIPNASLLNSSISINGTNVSLGQSITIPTGLTLQSVKTSNFTALSGNSYPVNTTSGAVTVTLPASPVFGDQINIIDYSGTASTNRIIIYPNGLKINGNIANSAISTIRASVTLIYTDSIQGWVDVSIGNSSYIPQYYQVQVFAWGGGGAGGYASGAGGGGGAVNGYFDAFLGSNYAVVVGGGGSTRAPNGGPGPTVPGGGGFAGNLGYGGQGGGYSGIFLNSSSQANALLIAGGGGGGAYEGANGGAGGGSSGLAGGNGAQAGGGGGTQSSGGSSVSQWGSALQGGSSGSEGDSGGSGGGGGGYFGGGAGSNTNPGSAGGGGSGFYNSSYVTGATLTAGSGTTPGDSSNSLRGSYGNGGASGANNGTQGILIIRYLGAQRGSGGTVTSSGGYTYHTFTSAGTFTG